MIHKESQTMHTPPSDIEKAVESAKSVKHNLNTMFEQELLAQIANFLNNCNPCWLSELDGCLIKLKAKYIDSPTTGTKIITKVAIGSFGFSISPDELIENGLRNYSMTSRSFRITSENIFSGLENAYRSIVSKIDKGDKVAGLSVHYRLFGEPLLVLNL